MDLAGEPCHVEYGKDSTKPDGMKITKIKDERVAAEIKKAEKAGKAWAVGNAPLYSIVY